MEFNKLVSSSLTDLFVKELQRMIISGELKEGEKLPTEQQLSEKMGVSRAVVYGGIKKLEKLGFVRIAPRKGVYVADYIMSGNIETLYSIIEFSGRYFSAETLMPIVTIRRRLESEMVQLAAINCTEEYAVELDRLIENLMSMNNPREESEAIYDIYHYLGGISGNIIYPLLVSTFHPAYVPLLEVMIKYSEPDVCREYLRKTVEAVKRGDVEAAVEIDAEFVDLSAVIIRDHFKHGDAYSSVK